MKTILIKDIKSIIFGENNSLKETNENMTEENIKMVLSNNIDEFEKLENKYKTEEICNFAVTLHGKCLSDVPEKMRTYDMCMLAFKTYPNAVYTIPKKWITYDMWKIAVEYNAFVFEHVPSKFLTEELCLIALKCRTRSTFPHIPKNMLTQEMCELVADVLEDLQLIPLKFRTKDFFFNFAINARSDYYHREGMSLKYFNHISFSELEYFEILKKDFHFFKYIPDSKKTKKMCEYAIEEHGSYSHPGQLLIYVPKKWRSEEMCLTAFKNDGYDLESLRGFPNKFFTPDLIIKAINISPYYAIKNIPDMYLNEDLYYKAMELEAKAFLAISKDSINIKMCLFALKQKKYTADILNFILNLESLQYETKEELSKLIKTLEKKSYACWKESYNATDI